MIMLHDMFTDRFVKSREKSRATSGMSISQNV